MRSTILTCLLIVLTAVVAIPSQAAELFVFPDGSGLYPTIQDALDEAVDGDIVYLMPGTYTGPGNRDLNVADSITIRSNDIGNPSIIDCQGSAGDPHRGFSLQEGIPSLEYLVVRNGYADIGGAVLGDGGEQIFLNYCRFENNTATQNGGALHTASGDVVTVDHCIFTENFAGSEGGAVYADDTEVKLYNCTLFRNEAPNGSGVFLIQNAVGRLNSTIIAYGLGGQACNDYYGGGYIVGCTDIFANQGGDWVGELLGQDVLNNNAHVDPRFCDPMGSPANFHLMGDSPVGNAHPCNALGAKLPDLSWLAPVYGVMADGKGMFPTIQTTIDAMPDPAIVSLEDGTYTGVGNRDIELRGKLLVVRGRSEDPANVIIDVEGTLADPHRGFYVHDGGSTWPALEHMTIRNGFVDEGTSMPAGGTGGAILVTGETSLYIRNCRFENNTAYKYNIIGPDNGRGAAIHAVHAPIVDPQDHENLWVEDCTFNGNRGDQTVLVESGSLQMISCTFRDNPACVEITTQDWPCLIRDSVFEDYNNYAVRGAGLSESLELKSCEFRPVISVSAAVILNTCSDVLFSQCVVDSVHVGSGPFGVANAPVWILNSTVSFVESTFTRNRAFLRGTVYAENSTCSFVDCDFAGNSTATGFGSAIHLDGGAGYLTNCAFTDNSSGRGGAVYATGAVVSLDLCGLSGNSSSQLGGGAYFMESTVDCTGTDFSNNTGTDGGGFYAESCDLTVDNCTFDANSSGLRHHGSSLGGISITGTTFSNHTSGWAAEIDSMLTRPVVIDQCAFRTGTQGLRLFEVPDFRLANTEFSDNPGNRTLSLSNSVGAVDTCSFDRNTASSEGGALYMLGSDVSLLGCSFADNSTAIDGGAVNLQSGAATFGDCRFDRNHSTGHGGALAGLSATAVLTDCTFSENTADGTGGAIYTFDVQTTVNSCDIINCTAASLGGGAYHRNGNTWYNGGRMAGNDAGSGGGLATSAAMVELNNLQIVGNTATNAGAANIFVSNLTMTNCEVVANEAANHGGLYLYQGTTAVVSGTLIAQNTTSASGGSGVTVAIGATATFLQTTISDNDGVGAQSQVLCDDNADAAFSACVVAFGGNGPAVAVQDTASTVQIETSNVYGNSGGDWTGPLAGLEGTAFNFSRDPEFCDTSLRDYHLADTSPCVGGNNPSGLDIGAYGTGCGSASGVEDDGGELPRNLVLHGNTPNPFNPRTNISFDLPADSSVVLEIYDVSGRRVRSLVGGRKYPAGRHQVIWDGADDAGQAQSSGIYLYRLEVSGRSLGGKMALLR